MYRIGKWISVTRKDIYELNVYHHHHYHYHHHQQHTLISPSPSYTITSSFIISPAKDRKELRWNHE